MRLPSSVSVAVELAGKRVPGLFIDVVLRTKHKNHFLLVLGPTDERGMISFTREQILEECDRHRSLFIMDYSHPEQDSAGAMDITVTSLDNLQRAVEGFDAFHETLEYPGQRRVDLVHALETMSLLDKGRPRAVLCEVVDADPRFTFHLN